MKNAVRSRAGHEEVTPDRRAPEHNARLGLASSENPALWDQHALAAGTDGPPKKRNPAEDVCE